MQFRSFLKIFVPLAIGILFIYLSLRQTTPEQQQEIWQNIKEADLSFVMLSIFFGLLSHLSRAYRWRYLLKPLGYRPRLINCILTVFVTYLANLGIPRSGEVLRASLMWNYEKIPFEKSFGTIVLERLVDLFLLGVVVVLALILQFDLIWNALSNAIQFDPKSVGWSLGIVWLLILGLRQLWKKSFAGKERLQKFISGIRDGLLSFRLMDQKLAFVAHSLFIWTMYVAMFYVIKWTLPETVHLGLEALLPAFVIGALAISTTNGGIGVYPFGVALILQSFAIAQAPSLSFGWIIWTAQTVMIILAGGLSFVLLPLVNRLQAKA